MNFSLKFLMGFSLHSNDFQSMPSTYGFLTHSILSLLFTTPIPAIAFYYLTHPTPEIRSDGMMTNTINGKVYKMETWEKTSTHKKFADKLFVADSAQEAMYGDKAYKKDSTWIYFDDNGDTLKLEYYK